MIPCLILFMISCSGEEEDTTPQTGNKILKFTLRDYSLSAAIDHEKGTIRVRAGALVDLSTVQLMMVLSPGAVVSPADTEPFDLTSPISFKVTSETGESRTYAVAADAHSSYDPGAQNRIETYNMLRTSPGEEVMNSDEIGLQ